MKRSLFLLLTVLSISTAVAEPNYYGETGKEIYIDKELTLLSLPEINTTTKEFVGFVLVPKKEYEHYCTLPKDMEELVGILPETTSGIDITKLMQRAVDYAFTPAQRIKVPKDFFLMLDIYWNAKGEVYMVQIYFKNKSYFTSIPAANYAKLMRYVKQNLKFLPPYHQFNTYDHAFMSLKFDVEALQKDMEKHKRSVKNVRQGNERIRHIMERSKNQNPGNGK